MQLHSLPLGPLNTNCYWLVDDTTRRAILFDPGYGPAPVLAALKGYTVEAIILTHGHWDHVYGVREAKRSTGAPVWISAIERDWLLDPKLNRSFYRTDLLTDVCDGPAPDRLLREGDTFSFAGRNFSTLLTPGHTPGSLTFATDGLILCGDVLFRQSIGRSDLPGGSMKDLVTAIRTKLLPLPDDTVVATGHGTMTTIGHEREFNPFVGRNRPLLTPDE